MDAPDPVIEKASVKKIPLQLGQSPKGTKTHLYRALHIQAIRHYTLCGKEADGNWTNLTRQENPTCRKCRKFYRLNKRIYHYEGDPTTNGRLNVPAPTVEEALERNLLCTD